MSAGIDYAPFTALLSARSTRPAPWRVRRAHRSSDQFAHSLGSSIINAIFVFALAEN
jgi:hypothetical protein